VAVALVRRGCTVRVASEKYKITFVKPNGAPDESPSLLDAGAALVSVVAGVPVHSLQGLFDVGRPQGRRRLEAGAPDLTRQRSRARPRHPGIVPSRGSVGTSTATVSG
jgi:hypothetical protein